MLNSTAVDLPLMKLAVLISQFLQLYLYINTLPATSKSLSDTLALDEPKLPFLEFCLSIHHSKIMQVRRNVLDVSYHVSQYQNIIAELKGEIGRLKEKINIDDVSLAGHLRYF